MKCTVSHLEVMASNPDQVELPVHSTSKSYLNKKNTSVNQTVVELLTEGKGRLMQKC